MDDHDLQMERASQAGSVSGMEVEDEESQHVRDADMEMHDIETEGHIADVRHASDEDMAAEVLEQDQSRDSAVWKVPDLELTDAKIDETIQDSYADEAVTPSATEPEADVMASAQSIPEDEVTAPAVVPESETVVDIANHSAAQDADNADTAEHSAPTGEVPAASNDANSAEQDLKNNDNTDGVQIPAVSEAGHSEDAYDDADEDYLPGSDDHEPHAALASTSYKPTLQRGYLRHVNVLPEGINASEQTWVPHCSLIYDNLAYSLFRPSSTPSGDDENVIFGEDENGGNALYYASLTDLMDKLHEAFPELKGDCENEIILDFGALEMQISQDNLYASQLSLHDFDRIRAGMCQPELDRLQVNLIVGKRFVQRFNELAEHCYRIYAGSHDDDDDEGTVAYPELGDDTATVEDTDALQQREIANEASETNAAPANEGRAVSTEDDDEGEGSANPPSDEHYEDGEFAEEDAEADAAQDETNAPNNDNNEEERYNDDDDVTVQGNDADYAEGEVGEAGQAAAEEIEEYVEPIDLTASLADAAEQAEEYDDAIINAQDGIEAKGVANGIMNGDADLVPGPSVREPSRMLPNEDAEKEYYSKLMSPTNEETRLLANGDGVTATLLDANYVEVSADTQPGRSLPGKRSYDDLAEPIESADSVEGPTESRSKRHESHAVAWQLRGHDIPF